MTSCTTQTMKPTPTSTPEPLFTFVDSTLFFNDRNSSISMRTTFNKGTNYNMVKGYFFQFRTITKKPIFLSSVSIVAGGKRLFLEEGQLLLTEKNSVTLNLSLENSLLITQFPKVLFQFKQNNKSEIFIIDLHQLDQYIPSENI
jgi:hypothetical protein